MVQQDQHSNKSILIKCSVIVVILTILGGAGMFGLAKHRQKTSYVASRSVIISHDIHEQASDKNGNPDIDMMPTYRSIVEDAMVGQQARHYLPKKLQKKYSANDISDLITTHISNQSLVMDLKVETSNKNDSPKIINAVAKGFQKELPKIQPGAGQVRLMAPATKKNTSAKTTPHVKKYVVVGMALGCLAGLIISFLYATWAKLL